MGAFNWVAVETTCLDCGENVEIRCQTHIASDYDGDERGRFHDREYRLNEAMFWWPVGHPKFGSWRVDGTLFPMEESPEYDRECCYADCPTCGAELYAVLRFHENRPVELIGTGKVENWPSGYVQ